MSVAPIAHPRMPAEPLPENIRSTQPGGGFCYSLEMAWGRWRRWYLRTFWPGYVRRMAAARIGEPAGCPHEIVDSRDLKFCRNLTDCHWRPEDDRFRWREKIPLARWGLAEVQIMGWPLLALTVALVVGWRNTSGTTSALCLLAAVVSGAVLVLVVSFFRDPPRRIPQEPGLLVSPADGNVVEVAQLAHDEFVGGPAVRIAIFLTLFNVHVNRMPCRAKAIRLKYSPGKFLHADHPLASTQNESMWIGLEQDEAPYRRLVCRQVSGMVARRIVNDLRPGEVLERGAKFGMIKFGSRTELIVPAEGFEPQVRLGQWIKAGRDVVGKYSS
ncbi:MAG TPA: phosphatidylserine decarboxylase [Pirellulales bacterium]|jgi:phosphatidylserine decarboxylase|nr:phosphatidylserine decarboxylase [Pirellulales bacterium]